MITRSTILVSSSILLAALGGPRYAQATDHYAATAGPASWDVTGTWNTGTLVGSGDQVFIGAQSPGVATSSITMTGSTDSSSNVFLAENGTNPNGTLSLSAGATLTSSGILRMSNGTNGTSLFSLSGSTATFNGSNSSFGNASGGNATVSVDSSSTLTLHGADLVNSANSGSRATLTATNSSRIDEVSGDLNVANGTPSSTDARATFQVDATSRITVDNGAIVLNGAESGGAAVYTIPMASAITDLGKIYALNGISQIAQKVNGANVSKVTVNLDSTAPDITVGPNTFKQAASTSPISFNGTGFNIGQGAGAVAVLNLKQVTLTNVGTSGGTNNRPGNSGGSATVFMDGASLSHSLSSNLDAMNNGTTGGRFTLSLINGSNFSWANGDMTIATGGASTDSRANFNIDATSKVSFPNGGLQIDGADNTATGGIAVYNLPLTSTSGSLGKLYVLNGISAIAGQGNNKVTVSLDSTAADYTIGANTYKAAADSAPINFNNAGFNIANGSAAVGELDLKNVTLTNVGANGGTNNRLANNTNSTATVNMDGSSLSHNGAMPSDLDLVSNGSNGARATLNLKNSSFISWAGGNLQVDGANAPTGVNSRAFLNVDSTSYMNFTNASGAGGSLVINGGESGGMATYTIPMASAASTPGMMYFSNGIQTVGQTAGSQVTLNVDSTAADYVSGGTTYKAAASSSAINFNSSGFNIGQGASSVGVVNLKNVTVTSWGAQGGTNNRPGNSGGNGTLFMNGASVTETATGTNLDSVNNGTTGGRFTLSLINGSSFSWGVGSMTIAANSGTGTTDSRANFNIDSTSKVSFPTGGLIIDGAESAASGGIAVYNIPLTSTSGALGKLYVQNGIQNIASIGNSKVTVNVDSTAADYVFQSNTYKAAASSSINANNNGLSIGTASGAQGRLNLTSVTYSNVGQVTNGSNGGTATLSLNNATLSNNNSSSTSLFNGDANTSTKAQIIMSNGSAINMIDGQNITNRGVANGISTAGAQITGAGTISFAGGGTFTNNGQVVANGGLLSITGGTVTSGLTTAAQVSAGFYGENGWFATSGSGLSKVTLPGLTGVGSSVAWGEQSNAATPLLVNSVYFHNANLTGTLNGSLLAPDFSADSAILALLIHPIDVWDFSTTGTLTSADMTVRYDDALATTLGLNQSQLKLFHYTNGAWVNITNTVNTGTDTIDSVAFTSFSPFAVAQDTVTVPEPSTFVLAGIGLAGLGLVALRRKYRRA